MILTSIIMGTLSSMLGVGGGFLTVPVLILASGLTSHQAIGTSIILVTFTAVSATVAYSRQRRIDHKLGLLLTSSTVPAPIAGAYATRFISAEGLTGLFGAFLVAVAVHMVLKSRPFRSHSEANGWSRKLFDSGGLIFEFKAKTNLGVSLRILGGFSSGMFGVGGGAVMVPVMNVAVGNPIHLAVATSMFMMVFTSFSGAITHVLLGHVLINYALPLCMGTVLGAQVGAAVSRRLKTRSLERVFGLCLTIVGVRMMLEYCL